MTDSNGKKTILDRVAEINALLEDCKGPEREKVLDGIIATTPPEHRKWIHRYGLHSDNPFVATTQELVDYLLFKNFFTDDYELHVAGGYSDIARSSAFYVINKCDPLSSLYMVDTPDGGIYIQFEDRACDVGTYVKVTMYVDEADDVILDNSDLAKGAAFIRDHDIPGLIRFLDEVTARAFK